MPKAKRRLIDTLKSLPSMTRPRSVSWDAKLADENPKLKAEIDETIDAFLAGAEDVRNVCGNKTTLAKWLQPNVAKYVANHQAVVTYIDRRRK